MTETELNWTELRVSLVVQMVKNPPAMLETWVWSLCWEDPLEKGMATHSSIPAWRIPWTEEQGRLQSMGSQRVGYNWVTFTSLPSEGTFFFLPLRIFPGKNTGVGCHALFQGIFPTQGLNPGLQHCRWILYHLSHQGIVSVQCGINIFKNRMKISH